jgi:hypothetical protein
MRRTKDPLTHLLSHRRISAAGCWEWTACTDAFGYGKFQSHNRRWLVHRLAWTLLVAPIPPGRYILHRCDNPTLFQYFAPL